MTANERSSSSYSSAPVTGSNCLFGENVVQYRPDRSASGRYDAHGNAQAAFAVGRTDAGSPDTDASGQYSFTNLDTATLDGVSPWWGWYSALATWNDNGTPRAAGILNFRAWPGVPIRMDVWFDRR